MKNKFNYGKVLAKESQIFRFELYKDLGIKKLFSEKKVLDLGCGFGLDSLNFSKFATSVVGVDVERHKYWKEIKNKKIKFINANAENLPFKNGEFNAIYMKDFLHHVKNVNKVLKEIKRVSANRSTLIIVEGNRYNPVFFIYATKIKGHEHFTQIQFKKIISDTFTHAQFTSLESYPPFFLNEFWYKKILFLEKKINKLNFLRPIFSYNVAIVKN